MNKTYALRHPVLMTAVAVAASLAGGCGTTDAARAPEIPSRIQVAFRSCSDIPTEILSNSGLTSDPRPDPSSEESTSEEVKTRGCTYHGKSGDNLSSWAGISIEETNMTTDYYRFYHHESTVQPRLVSGQKAVVKASTDSSISLCMVLVDVPGGAVRFDTGTSSRDDKRDPCQILVEFADEVTPIALAKK
ncbi:hypothetical protein ACFYTQ_12305 [Nocardia sp. NPDC004068]|uniref:hypothetical protein n=1 Tax=Nocardia sp. NPDC004068 TaxID=3364303 RepID=UPI0036C7F33F